MKRATFAMAWMCLFLLPAFGARAGEVDYLITTQKDIAKMSFDMLQVPNLLVLQVRQAIDEHDRFIRLVFECLELSVQGPGRDS